MKRNQNFKRTTWVVLALSLVTVLASCSDSTPSHKVQESRAVSSASDNGMASGAETASITTLIKDDVNIGTGAEAKQGQTVSVHYTGWLYDPNAADKHGKQFDSSRTRGTPFKFPLGAGRVIKGWDQGVAGMKVGGKRTLTIPAQLAYGARGAGGVIPPNAVLVFDVELMGVE
jgi:FKBP-type peptidyl-prolyl cis-trans isomerase